ncbi:uncharacterized protein LAESUDRAFT_722322 [Laetiporus sulphureus 93-53]|uniref:Uncharacterized protein n=1 Tax=Laetiporus sulphureus 93-53 TaxID=1314785 RepID=A0A165GCH5_9APHY|nr:uncharacterized protein LAESUDRAFT_722322 [Laetiporus sulphureus 93-53]KZT10156.1 hypothetical protein LAESUDRAFT_722322 [Laetiporus sulphureus 93-53]
MTAIQVQERDAMGHGPQHAPAFSPLFVLRPRMTWILGYPLSLRYAIQFAKDHGVPKRVDRPSDFDRSFAALEYIAARSGVEDVLSCWVDGESQMVFALSVDYKSGPYPPKRVHRSRTVPDENIRVLAYLLKTAAKPAWYRYDDGTYTPWQGECLQFADDGYDSDSCETCDERDAMDEDSDDVGEEGSDAAVGDDERDEVMAINSDSDLASDFDDKCSVY